MPIHFFMVLYIFKAGKPTRIFFVERNIFILGSTSGVNIVNVAFASKNGTDDSFCEDWCITEGIDSDPSLLMEAVDVSDQ